MSKAQTAITDVQFDAVEKILISRFGCSKIWAATIAQRIFDTVGVAPEHNREVYCGGEYDGH